MKIQYFPHKDLTQDQIKTEYRKLARKWHPDKPGGSEMAMKIINNEYNFLISGGRLFEPVPQWNSTSSPVTRYFYHNGRKYDLNNTKDKSDLAKMATDAVASVLINIFVKF